jgi:hypothetical protein
MVLPQGAAQMKRRRSGSAQEPPPRSAPKAERVSLFPRALERAEKEEPSMMHDRALLAQAHDPPRRIPETALRDAVREAVAATAVDGLDRTVVFDVARRRVRVETWPADERPGLIHLADITTEAAP